MIDITLKIEKINSPHLAKEFSSLVVVSIDQKALILSPDKYSKVHGLLSEIAKCITESNK